MALSSGFSRNINSSRCSEEYNMEDVLVSPQKWRLLGTSGTDVNHKDILCKPLAGVVLTYDDFFQGNDPFSTSAFIIKSTSQKQIAVEYNSLFIIYYLSLESVKPISIANSKSTSNTQITIVHAWLCQYRINGVILVHIAPYVREVYVIVISFKPHTANENEYKHIVFRVSVLHVNLLDSFREG